MASTFTAAVLAGTLAVGAAVGPAAAEPAAADPARYDDVAAGDTHAAAIERATDLQLLRGVTERRFEPATSLTRGQVASVLQRTLEATGVALPDATEGPSFDDVAAPHADAIRQLAAVDVVQGVDEDRYEPGVAVTRAQLAALVTRTVTFATGEQLTPEDDVRFVDVGDDDVHRDAVALADELGLLIGDEDRFAPQATTRRDQAATVVTRVFDALDRDWTQARATGEVWALDQGTDLIHVHDGGDDLDEAATIDVRSETLRALGFDDAVGADVTNIVPHMIEFDSQERYAFIASTAGAVTIVVDARTKQVVEVLPTGAGTHMAAVTPDDSAVWVAVIGTSGRESDRTQRMVEIPLDLDAAEPTFGIGRDLPVEDLLGPLEAATGYQFPSFSPVCHQYSADSSEAWITLGPGWDQGGLVVLDLESGELVTDAAFDPDEVRANCGVSVTEDTAVVNWSGQVVDGDNTAGETYVIDPETYELERTIAANGFDTHGLRLTPDGSEYWQVNRISDELLVLDGETLEVVDEVDTIADTPDILDFSPDGTLAFVTQRGPAPRSGAPHAATGDDPGVAVVDVADRSPQRVLRHEVLSSDDGEIVNDVHGIGVRTPSVRDVRYDQLVQAVPASATTRTAALDAPRPAPASHGFHCEL